MVFLSTGVFQTRSIEHIAYICKDEQITGLELSSGLAHIPNFEEVVREVEDLSPLLIHNYFPAPKDPFMLNLASTDPEVIDASLTLCKTALDLCERFNIPFYSVHGGIAVKMCSDGLNDEETQAVLKERFEYNEAYDTFCENILSISSYAREKGIRLLVENNTVSPANLDSQGSPQLLMADIDEIEQFFQDISDPNVGLLVDVGHVKVTSKTLGFDKDTFITRLAGRIEAFHLSENDGVFDLNEPVREDSWFLPHLSHFPDACFILEAYRLTLPQITAQRSLIEKHLSNEMISDYALDEG